MKINIFNFNFGGSVNFRADLGIENLLFFQHFELMKVGEYSLLSPPKILLQFEAFSRKLWPKN